MTTVYPAQIDTVVTLPTAVDNVTPIRASVVNNLRDAILRIESSLGVAPGGVYGSVAARFIVLEHAFAGPITPGSISFFGDLSGSNIFQTVVGLQNNPISTLTPVNGDVLTWNGGLGQWNPEPGGGGGGSNATALQGFPISATPPLSGQVLEYNGTDYVPTTITATLAGDITGPIGTNTISKIRGVTLASTSPTQSTVIVYDTAGTQYHIRQLTQDDILPGFSISNFTGGSIVECGVTVTNPAFTASYSSTPTSAQIANTDGVDSPLVLISPFTSGTVVGSFTHSTVNFSVTFTLTAIKGITKTANQFITYEARSFGGVGAAGATSSVTASGNNAILSTADTLSDEGLHSSDVGQSYGLFSPSGQKIYLLLQGGSHTFKDQNGFTFPMNSPTAVSFTNQHGAVISMFLYESTNLLSTPFTITVVT